MTQPTLFDPDAGKQLRDTGTTIAGSLYPDGPAWRADADAAIQTLALTSQEFSADDLVGLVGPPPHPNMLGGVFLSASRQGLIRSVGIRQGARPSAHARLQRTWTAT